MEQQKKEKEKFLCYFDGQQVVGVTKNGAFSITSLGDDASETEILDVYQSVSEFRKKLFSYLNIENDLEGFCLAKTEMPNKKNEKNEKNKPNEMLAEVLDELVKKYVKTASIRIRVDMDELIQSESRSKDDPEVDAKTGTYYTLGAQRLLKIVEDIVNETAKIDRGPMLSAVVVMCHELLIEHALPQTLELLEGQWPTFQETVGFPKIVAWINNLASLVKLVEEFSDRAWGLVENPFVDIHVFMDTQKRVPEAFYAGTKRACMCLYHCIFSSIPEIEVEDEGGNYRSDNAFLWFFPCPLTEQQKKYPGAFSCFPRHHVPSLVESVICQVADWLDDLQHCVSEMAIRKVYLECIKKLVSFILYPLFFIPDFSERLFRQHLERKKEEKSADEVLADELIKACSFLKERFAAFTIFPVSMNEKILARAVQPIMDCAFVIDWVPDASVDFGEIVGVLPIMASQLSQDYPDTSFELFEALVRIKTALTFDQKNQVLSLCRPYYDSHCKEKEGDGLSQKKTIQKTESIFSQYFPKH